MIRSLAFLLMLLTWPALAAVDPLAPIPFTEPCTFIRHDEMLARMAAQHNGAKVTLTGVNFDASGRKLEAYYDPVEHMWRLTIVTRTLNSAGSWAVKTSSPTCQIADSDPLPIPAP